MALISLTVNPDNWLGTTGNDIIDAKDGDDTLDGALGNDSLIGNLGHDLIAGGAGLDTLIGGDGDDVLDGGIGNDFLYGGNGNDFIYGGAGVDILNGGAGGDYFFGGADNDKIFGGAGSDSLEGGDGADILTDTDNLTSYGMDSAEHDEMSGGIGNDTFYGGYDVMSGDDGDDVFNVNNQGTVYGGIGNDKITVTNASASLHSWLEGGLGSDSIVAGAGNDTLISGYGQDTLVGGAGNDNYVVTFDNLADMITDTAGIDTVYYIRDFMLDGRDDDFDAVTGKENDPLVSATAYNVTLAANIENGVLDDQIYVSNPNTLTYTSAWLTGNTLNNTLQGSNLNDILNGGAGNDTIKAGDGNDIIFAGDGTDMIDGGAGRDLIASGVSFDLTTTSRVEDIDLLDVATALVATGNSANNLLLGNKFNNTLIGAAGNDTLDGMNYSPNYAPVTITATSPTGNDTLIGGTGNDLYRIDAVTDRITEVSTTTGGVDTVEFKGAVATDTYILENGVENLVIKGNLKIGVGNHLNNRMIGDAAANTLKGGYGNDFLDGGSGLDSFEGGYGDDTFVVDNVLETIKEDDGQGSDWVQSANVNLDLNAQGNWVGVENARLTGTSVLNVSGRETNNYLIGNAGNNVLDGRGVEVGGADTMEGGDGNDTYIVDTTTDVLIEASNVLDTSGKIKAGWIDTVQSDVNFTLASLLNFENLSLGGSSATVGTGNVNDNLLRGNSLANTLNGLAGNDTLDGSAGADNLIGGAGNDTYRLSNDGDVITELANEGTDTIEIQNTFSLLSYANIENLTLIGTTAMDGTGNSAANVITGNTAANLLTGLVGNDTLKGGEGADTLVGGSGVDVLDLTESAQSRDVVRIGSGDSIANASEADKVIKFAQAYDKLDLGGTFKIGTAPVSEAGDFGIIKSMLITNGIAKFDDFDSFTNPLSISATNLNDVIGYLKLNITDGSSVGFQAGSDTWVFQDGGANDTLVDLVGVSNITGLSGTAGSGTTLWIM